MSTKVKALAAAIAALAFAQTATAISIDFSTPNIDLSGGAVTENIAISGLLAASQAVSGYDIYVDFNSAVLAAGTITINPLLNDCCSAVDTGTAGIINLQDYSLASDAQLVGQNLDSVVLASIVFTPTGGTGFSSPTFDFTSSFDGPAQVTGLLDPRCANPTGASVPGECPFPVLLTFGTVPPSVPEPATLGLLAIGLAGLGFARRRARS